MNTYGSGMALMGIIPTLLFLFYLVIAGLGLFCLILLIKLLKRGIRLLDIMIHEKSNRHF